MLDQNRLHNLLKKYDRPGPRYTSYPTVPAWKESIGPKQYEESLGQLKDGGTLSLYFHLPFCENLCHFCGCTQVITKDHSRSQEYIQILLKEINQVCEALPKKTRDVVQLHFGGGTPNFLKPEEMTHLMQKIREQFNLEDEAEIAIEMHPRTSTFEFCKNLAQLGFNRISLGVQDLDPHVQNLINRHQTFEQTKQMVEDLRGLGFNSFNFDLVYGLPGQSWSGWEKTLDQIYSLRPNRLAVYSYAHVPWIRPVQRTFKDSDLPNPEQKLRLFEMAYHFFVSHDYHLIGMDHFALADDELAHAMRGGEIHRNFMGYSTHADAHQIGFGMSAISYVHGNYFQNKKKLEDYKAAMNDHCLASFRGYILSSEDQLRREIICALMCSGKIVYDLFDKKFGIDFKKKFETELGCLTSFVEDDLLILKEEGMEVKNYGFLFLRNMAMVFDTYLEGIRRNSKNPTFSRTV